MGPPDDWFTKVEYLVFRVFVLGSFIIAVVKIVMKECGGWPKRRRGTKEHDEKKIGKISTTND